jgi:Membrane transporters of cations and cationic drugs
MNIYLTLFISSMLAIFGQICIKTGADGGSLLKAVWSPWLWAGLAGYFFSTLLWVYALTRVHLGVAYAFTALTFVGVYVASFFILKESVTVPKILGLVLVVSGFLVLTKWG